MNAGSWSLSCASRAAWYYNSFNLDDEKWNLAPLAHIDQVLLSRDKPLLRLLMTLPVRGAGPITARRGRQQPMSGGGRRVSQSGAYTVTFPVDGCGHDAKTRNQVVMEVIINTGTSYAALSNPMIHTTPQTKTLYFSTMLSQRSKAQPTFCHTF